MRGLFRRNPGFGRLVAGQVPADGCDWLAYVAMVSLLAYEWEAPTLAFAWFGVALGLPYLTVGLVAGALVDRLPLRVVLAGANLGRALVFAAMTQAGSWQALVLLLALGQSVDSFFTPAKQAALQALVAEPDRMAANGLSHGINQTSKVVAPALGGALIAVMAPGQVFVLNALLCILAGGLFLALPGMPRAQQADEGGAGLLGQVRSGLALIGRTPALRAVTGLMAAGFFATFFYDTLIAPLLRDLGFAPRVLGWALTAVGGGGILGAVLAARGRGGTARAFRTMGLAGLVGGLLVGAPGAVEAAGGTLPLWLLLGVFGAIGVTSALVMVPARVVIQNEAPAGTMARVSSVSEAVNTAALLTAPFAGAALASVTSLGVAFVAGGAMAVGTGLAALRIAARMPVSAPPPGPTPGQGG